MHIVVHLGDSVKSYRELTSGWRSSECVCAEADVAMVHDGYPHWAGPGEEKAILILRFRGRDCRRVFSVLPDILLPGCSYPAAVRDRAVAAYVRGQGTYEEIARGLGVAKSTVWRWVHQAGLHAAAWLEQSLTLLRQIGLPSGPVTFRHELRSLFLRRRVRRPGMLESLILIEALLGLVARAREALLRAGRGPLPAGLHAFGRHVLDRLGRREARAGPDPRDGTSWSPRGG